ncbi:MAG: aspartate aminotransferase family protein [Ardenticatenaceae bacterium]|nr:aspartate aminotransferase family protein [Ardenticatenaceae bacterium]HBY98413.1 aspartate aminotransferase family protein [Chloroflexota bacterium]
MKVQTGASQPGTASSNRTNQALMRRAMRVMPDGVSSNFRYWGLNDAIVVTGAKGSHFWDADGNEYIDYRLGFGPVILGHGYEPVVERVCEVIRRGVTFAFTTELEIKVAERMTRMCPGLEMVRFCNSGSEATQNALRVARGYTGREKIIKFEGHYHGMYDYMLFSTAGANPVGLGFRYDPIPYQESSGIPRAMRDLIITLPFNDFDELEDACYRQGHEVAAVIVEPVMGNVAGILPKPGFLERIRELCDEYGIIMIMDEVKTGFRIAPGGAQAVYGVLPDLATYAKALGNGFPVAAFGGKREVMEAVGHHKIAHSGTYNGNSVAMAAADATLEALEDGSVLETIGRRGKRLMEGIHAVLDAEGIPNQLIGWPQMFGLLLTDREEEVREYRQYARTEREFYEALMMALVRRGIVPDSDAREPWFLCYQHEEEDIDLTLEILREVAREVKENW